MMLKVCGITRLTDALHAVKHGATGIGFVFWPKSPRCVAVDRAADIVRALPDTVTTVGVFVDQPVAEVSRIAAAAGITTIQLHGDEPPAYADALGWPVWRAVSLETGDALDHWPSETTFLLDAYDRERRGGTGVAIDWAGAAGVAASRRVVLAGGLTPDNVAQAIATVHPWGVDVSSGVEEAPGVKDFDKVARFLEQARAAFTRH